MFRGGQGIVPSRPFICCTGMELGVAETCFGELPSQWSYGTTFGDRPAISLLRIWMQYKGNGDSRFFGGMEARVNN